MLFILLRLLINLVNYHLSAEEDKVVETMAADEEDTMVEDVAMVEVEEEFTAIPVGKNATLL